MKRIRIDMLMEGMVTDEAGSSPLDIGIGLFCRGRSHNGMVRYLNSELIEQYGLDTPPGFYMENETWPVSEYQPVMGPGSLQNEINDKRYPRNVRFLWPAEATQAQGQAAAAHFEPGTRYDIAPYVKRILELSGMFNPFCAWLATLVPNVKKWLYCTEGCRDRWLTQGVDPWRGNPWANPGDTVTATEQGAFEIMAECIEEIPAWRWK